MSGNRLSISNTNMTFYYNEATTTGYSYYHCYSSVLTILIYLIANKPVSTAKEHLTSILQSAVRQHVSIFRLKPAPYTGSLNQVIFLSKNRYDFF